ncbi:MAG: HNH endonuclease [Rhodanobacteraceae bacterium]|nr:HNH endonuclease [Rhodanobacteraceae bacterium]
MTHGDEVRTVSIALGGQRGVGLFALIDEIDEARVKEHGWSVQRAGYVVAQIDRRTVLLHRFVAQPEAHEEIDHRNRNKLDCRRANLRVATRAQNNANIPVRKDSTSGIKGVRQIRRTGRWQARITVNRRQIHLGIFNDKDAAVEAYANAARVAFGEFANV